MIEYIEIIGYSFAALVVLQALLFAPGVRQRRHKRYVKTSRAVLKKISSIQGPGADAKAISYLKKVNPYVFEELILTALENQGADIQRNASYSDDGGIDGRFTYQGKQFAIQAKRYKDHINKQHVARFTSIANRYDGGVFVHTGKTGAGAWQTLPRNIQMISGNRLLDLLLRRKQLDHIINIA